MSSNSVTQAKKDYSASDIRVLEGLEPVRKRPGMYIGSTDTHGLHHLVKEIMDNSVDEAIAGFAKQVHVYLMKDGHITVTDDGRGIPVEKHPSGISALEVVMTKLHAGGKFDEKAYKASGGLHGVGASAVNALSKQLRVIIKRVGKYYFQEYSIGIPKASVKEISESKVKELFPLQSKYFVTYKSGTLVDFIPDNTIFSTTKFDAEIIEDLIRDRAYLMAGLYFRFMNEESGTERHYYFESGIRSLVAHLNNAKKPLHSVIYVEGTYESEKYPIGVEVALQYNDTYAENIHCYANVIYTPDGGTHLTGFRMALNKSLKDYATKNGLIKEEKDSFTSEDLREGLTAVVFVKMSTNEIQFESQTKAKLNNAEAQSAVYQIVKDKLDMYLEEHPREARTLLEKVLLAARARLAARAAKDAVIRKGALEGSTLPGKLADCQENDPAKSEIFIVEGDSAGGCWGGETKIALTDSRNLSFIELIKEEHDGKKNFCYTMQNNGHIGITPIIHARLTKKKAKVIKIILDNNEELMCTPDHPFRLVDGTYVAAEKLTPEHNLAPLYRKLSSKNKNKSGLDGYEMVLDPKEKRWMYTHVLSDIYNLSNDIYGCSSGKHRHHVDFNKLNNNPTNIQRVSYDTHMKIHYHHLSKTLHRPDVKIKSAEAKRTDVFRYKARQKSLEKRELFSRNAKKQWQSSAYKEFMKRAYLHFYENDTYYREKTLDRLNNAQKVYWSVEQNRAKQSERVKQFFFENQDQRNELSEQAIEQWKNPELRQWRAEKTSHQWTQEFRTKRKLAYNKAYYMHSLQFFKRILEEGGSLAEYEEKRVSERQTNVLSVDTLIDRFFEGDTHRFIETALHYNHKIIRIEKVLEKMDVYDLEVPETHNFALAAGIFVHNSAKQGRDRRFQAIFPLRGKILNTERARLDKIIDFEELKNLIIALGTGIGDTFDEKKLRYHRVVLMNDADVDGEHITTLALTFFFRHLPDVVKNGYLYIALPPLFKVWTKKDTSYVYSEQERDDMIAKFKKDDTRAVVNVQRYKGLGEMNPEQLWETTMNPKTRILKKVTIEDVEKADVVFTTLMGEDVPPRKKFIQSRAKLANLDI